MVKYRVAEGTPIEAGVTLIAVSDGTADEDQVLAGATFYAGDTAKKTGNIATFEDGEQVYLPPFAESDPTVPAWAKKEKPPTPAEIGAAPAYTYGTADIEAGTASPYPEGTLHFIYEPAG
jgi:hypothetical protein